MTPAPQMGPPHKLRLAHVTHWLLPSNDTATIQLIQTLSALAELGVDAELYSPRRPWRRRPPAALQSALVRHYGVSCGFAPHELPSSLPGLPGLSRLLHATLAVRATPPSPAVLHTRDLETAWLGVKAGRRVLFETFKVWTRSSSLHRTRLQRLARQPGFLGIVTHSRYAREQYAEDGIPAAKLRTIHNGFDPRLFSTVRPAEGARAALGFPESPTVVYLGAIAPYKRVDLLLDAAERTPEIRWVLGGEHRQPAARALVQRGTALPNVAFPGFVSGEQLVLLLQAADVLVIPPSLDPLLHYGRTVLPIKVFQYLAAGRPIVTGESPDTSEVLVHDRNSVRIPPDDAAALAAAVRELVRDPDRRIRLGEAARRDSAGFTWNARARAFLDFLHERAGNGA